MNTRSMNNKVDEFIKMEDSKIKSFIYSLISPNKYNTSAEDIIQDVFVSFFNRIDFDSNIENLAAFIYRSIRNKIIDIQRKKKREYFIDNPLDNESSDIFSSMLTDENSVIESEEKNQNRIKSFYWALHELNPIDQELIIRTELEKTSFKELEQEFNIPIGTLLSRKHRAMAKLFKLIKEKSVTI